MIDISTIKVAEHPSLRILFVLLGNNTTTPEVNDWQINSINTIYDNTINNNEMGIYCYRYRPTILDNKIGYNDIGIQYEDCPRSAIASEDYQESYEVFYTDHFLSHGRLWNISNITIINGKATLETGKNQGYLYSENISLPNKYVKPSRWYRLDIEKEVPDNCGINITILGEVAGVFEIIPGFSNLNTTSISLMNIDSYEYNKIKIKATYTGNGSTYPSLLEWTIVTQRTSEDNDSFEDQYGIGGGYNVMLNNETINLNNRSWWNDDYKYRRNISLSEELGITRTLEYHDFQVNFSGWSIKPNCSDEIRIVFSNGTEAKREITDFNWNYSVNFTMNIEDISANGDSNFFIYYGCVNPTSPDSVDYQQTVVLLDENLSFYDEGGGWGPKNVENNSMTMMSAIPDISPPIGYRMLRLEGEDMSSSEDSYWYAEFSDDEKTIPSGSYLGYYIYWVNTSYASAMSGGLDGNYSGGGSMGEGSPLVYDQNNICFCPDEDLSQETSNSWYYRYTDDIGGSTITSWFLAYNDSSNNEIGNFTFYYDYIFFGPNRGPLSISIGEEETPFYQYGFVYSCRSGSSGTIIPNFEWNELYVNTTIDENQTIRFQLCDMPQNGGADDLGTPIIGWENLSGDTISLEGLDAELHPEIQLVAHLYSNGSGSPELHSWSVNRLRYIHSGIVVGNELVNNNYSICCDKSSPLIIDNIISNSDEKGLVIESEMIDNIQTTHIKDKMNTELYLQYNDMVDVGDLNVPKWSTITDVEISMTGNQYLPPATNETFYSYSGWINKSLSDQLLNTTVSMDKPNTWESTETYIYYYELNENGVEKNATSVNLTAAHNKTTHYFSDSSSKLYLNSSVVNATQDPVNISINSSSVNATGDFHIKTQVTNTTNVTWNETIYGYSTIITLFPPDADVIKPSVTLLVPHGGFASMDAYVVETHDVIADNFSTDSKESGYISLDLTSLSDIGNVWNSSDPIRTIRLNLSFYTKTPMIDIGGDGDMEWTWPGELNDTKIASSNELIREFNSHIGNALFNIEKIPILIGAGSASHLTNISIKVDWEFRPTIVFNTVTSCDVGIFTDNSSQIRIMKNIIAYNDIGIQVNSSVEDMIHMNLTMDGRRNCNLTIVGNINDTTYVKLPKGIYVTASSFNLTGSRYVPGLEENRYGYEYQGTCINTTDTAELNHTIWANRPTNWNAEMLEIYAKNLTREYGDAVAIWARNDSTINSSRWNDSEWINGNPFSTSDIRWIDSASDNKYMDQTVFYLNSSGVLCAKFWNGIGWHPESYVITENASNVSTLCFQGLYLEQTHRPMIIYGNNSTEIILKVFDDDQWVPCGNFSFENPTWVKAAVLPYSDDVVILAMNGTKNLTALYWNGSSIEFNWTLTTNLSNKSTPCFGIGIDQFSRSVIAGWGNGSNELVISIFRDSYWVNETSVNVSNVGRIECSGSYSHERIIFLASNQDGTLTSVIWNLNFADL